MQATRILPKNETPTIFIKNFTLTINLKYKKDNKGAHDIVKFLYINESK